MFDSLTVVDDNNLSSFIHSECGPLWNLRSLRLSENELTNFNLNIVPSIRALYLDKNRLKHISGLSSAKHLDHLSVREQEFSLNGLETSSVLDDCYDLRTLHLSGNALPESLQTKTNFLNLQSLELASCGLRALPPQFGHRFANVRVLNLNFNALKDIEAMTGIVRLKRLLLTGNRLTRLRKSANVLSQFHGLRELDMRSNPLTLGFYSLDMRSHAVLQAAESRNQTGSRMEPFTLPPAIPHIDDRYRKTLDSETELRREVYELIIAKRCKALRILDGLPSQQGFVESDETWSRLVALGVVHSGQCGSSSPEHGESEIFSDLEQGQDNKERLFEA